MPTPALPSHRPSIWRAGGSVLLPVVIASTDRVPAWYRPCPQASWVLRITRYSVYRGAPPAASKAAMIRREPSGGLPEPSQARSFRAWCHIALRDPVPEQGRLVATGRVASPPRCPDCRSSVSIRRPFAAGCGAEQQVESPLGPVRTLHTCRGARTAVAANRDLVAAVMVQLAIVGFERRRSEDYPESIARKPVKVSEHFTIVGRNSW